MYEIFIVSKIHRFFYKTAWIPISRNHSKNMRSTSRAPWPYTDVYCSWQNQCKKIQVSAFNHQTDCLWARWRGRCLSRHRMFLGRPDVSEQHSTRLDGLRLRLRDFVFLTTPGLSKDIRCHTQQLQSHQWFQWFELASPYFFVCYTAIKVMCWQTVTDTPMVLVMSTQWTALLLLRWKWKEYA